MKQNTVPTSRSASRWTMGVIAAGLVTAGAIGGGLLAREVTAQAGVGGEIAKPVARRVAAAPAKVCAHCGIVESVQTEARKGEASGVGAVAGGVIGGLIGNQMGGGNGKKAMTVVGAVGGGVAGHEIEKQQRSHTVFVTRVRMDDGTVRSFTRGSALAVGQRVTVEDGRLQLAKS
jgi:outer membrane lipoprotein SlyB